MEQLVLAVPLAQLIIATSWGVNHLYLKDHFHPGELLRKFLSGSNFLVPAPILLVPDSTLCPPIPLHFPSWIHWRSKASSVLKQVISSEREPLEKRPQALQGGKLRGTDIAPLPSA